MTTGRINQGAVLSVAAHNYNTNTAAAAAVAIVLSFGKILYTKQNTTE